MIAGFVALALPARSRSLCIVRSDREATAQQKIVSTIGTSDCVMLQSRPRGYTPLVVGEITLATLAMADSFALIPPESEGVAAGQAIAATPFNAMLEEQETP